MSELERFISEGTLYSVAIGDTEDRFRSILGEPEIYEPAHKSYPTFAIYGPLEFRIMHGKICYIGLTLDFDVQIPGNINFFPEDGTIMTIGAVREFFHVNNISYRTDEIMSDDSQTVLVTDRGVHLAFNMDGEMTKIASAPI